MDEKISASGPVNGFLRTAAFLQAVAAVAGMVYFLSLLYGQGLAGWHHIILTPLLCILALVASAFLFLGHAWAKVVTWLLQLAQLIQVSISGFAYLCYLGVGLFVSVPGGAAHVRFGGMLYMDLLPKDGALMSINMVPIGMVLLLGLSCVGRDCREKSQA